MKQKTQKVGSGQGKVTKKKFGSFEGADRQPKRRPENKQKLK